MYKPALGWRKRKIAMMHVTRTWVEDGKMVTETIPADVVYKREWVGLTRKEVHDLYDSDYVVFHQRIEAKLKEKNT